MKNKDLIMGNIQEAIDELDDILNDVNNDSNYTEDDLRIALEHAYHHLNYAWNIRNVEIKRIGKCSHEDFIKWSKYPIGEILEYE